jgi:hypothetical protein
LNGDDLRRKTCGAGQWDVVRSDWPNVFRPHYHRPEGPPQLSLAKRCAEHPSQLASICELARRFGRFGLVPYLSSESAWGRASAIAGVSGAPIWVAGPGPRLTRRINDKLWFSDRVAQLLGRRALPQTHYVFGPEALGRRIAQLAQTTPRFA